MKKDKLDGITLEGEPLKNQIDTERFAEPLDPEVNKEFKKNHHIYKSPGNLRFPEKPGKIGEVMSKKLEVNKANFEDNIVKALEERDIKKAIVSVLLCHDTNLSLYDIFNKIYTAADKRRVLHLLFFTDHSLRNPMGMILKTEFSNYLLVTSKSRSTTTYILNPVYWDKFNLEEAMKLIDDYNAPKKNYPKRTNKPSKPKPEKYTENSDSRQKLASFVLPGTDGKGIEINIFGKIQIEFSFK